MVTMPATFTLVYKEFPIESLLGQWLNELLTFWDYSFFSRENKPFKRLYFRGPLAKWSEGGDDHPQC